MKNNECSWNLSLEKQLYWVNGINEHRDKEEGKDLLIELMAISSTFHGEVIEFLRDIINHSSENPGRICHINLKKTGFQTCTCFKNEALAEESQKELGFLVFVEEELTWYWSFSQEEMREFIKALVRCFLGWRGFTPRGDLRWGTTGRTTVGTTSGTTENH